MDSNSTIIDWTIAFDHHILRTTSEALSLDIDPSAYWLSQPKSALALVALTHLVVPASSAPVERIFSHAGLICTPKRTGIKDDLLSALVCAKYNKI